MKAGAKALKLQNLKRFVSMKNISLHMKKKLKY